MSKAKDLNCDTTFKYSHTFMKGISKEEQPRGVFTMQTASILQLLSSAEKDAQWLNKNYPDLLTKYPDHFIAIHDGNFVDASLKHEELLNKIESKKLNPAEVMIEFVSKIKRIL